MSFMPERTLKIDRLAFGGDGVGRLDGKVVFVPLTAQGDRARVRLTEDGGRFSRAVAVEIVESSPDRVEPRCSVFGVCGGCQWQHLAYPIQLQAKESILRETLERIGKFSKPPVQPIVAASEPWGYRNRIQLHQDRGKKIGYYGAGSHRVVDFESCEIAAPALNAAVQKLRQESPKLPRSFELVLGGDDVVVQDLEDPERVFCQVHPQVNARLIEGVLQAIFGREELAFSRKRCLVELYAGDGNFTFPLAERAGKVLAVESSKTAVGRAEREARRRLLRNVEFIAGSVEWGLRRILRMGVVVDTLLLDPPRKGAREIIDLICVLKPRQVVYVACDPPTLARDLQLLASRHYQLESAQPFDMFPQTYHIETIAKLVRRNGG